MTDTLATGGPAESGTYSERLWPSLGVGLFGWTAVASLALGVARVHGPRDGMVALGIITVVYAVIVVASTPVVAVRASGLHAGRAVLAPEFIGDVRVLNREQTQHAFGAAAHRGAFLVTRAWIPESVIVTIDDSTDPHPYWQVSSRKAQRLARAVAQAAQ